MPGTNKAIGRKRLQIRRSDRCLLSVYTMGQLHNRKTALGRGLSIMEFDKLFFKRRYGLDLWSRFYSISLTHDFGNDDKKYG